MADSPPISVSGRISFKCFCAVAVGSSADGPQCLRFRSWQNAFGVFLHAQVLEEHYCAWLSKIPVLRGCETLMNILNTIHQKGQYQLAVSWLCWGLSTIELDRQFELDAIGIRMTICAFKD